MFIFFLSSKNVEKPHFIVQLSTGKLTKNDRKNNNIYMFNTK